MSNEFFWRYYLIFMAGILLIPIFRNIYCLCRYKIIASKYDKYVVEAFCKCATHVYIDNCKTVLYVTVIILIPACIFTTHYTLFFENENNGILSCIAGFILHILAISSYFECLYRKYAITNTAILIRSSKTKYTFYVIQLYDIIQYEEFSYIDFPHCFIDGDKSLAISTKDMKKFILYDMKNRDEFVAILKTFTENSKTGDVL